MPVFFKFMPAALTAAALLSAPAYTAAAETTAAIPRPAFPSSITQGMTVDAKLAAGLHFAQPAANPDILRMPLPDPTEITIAGEAVATEEQMLAYLLRRNPKPKLTGMPEELVHAYYEEAEHEGVRADVALAQAFKETGFFAYGGDVDWKQNNFCGLGATGNGAKGLSFPDIRTGARAHIQHLMAYATTERPHAPLVDPRYDLVRLYRTDIYGKIKHWTGLNGVWAVPGTSYGQDILLLCREATTPDASDASLAFAEKKLAEKKNAAAYVYRAIVLAKRGESERAAADLEAALRLSPKSAAALYDRALFFTAAGDEKRAKADLEALVKAQPDFAYAWYNLGVMNLKAGRNNAAMRDFERVLALVPQSANAQSNIGIALVREKKYREAWRAFAQAAEINTTNPTVLMNQIVFAACLKE